MLEVSRRDLLGGAAALAAGALLPARSEAAELLVRTSVPQNLETPIEVFDRLITPTPVFFVRSHFGPPALDPKRRLVIEGRRRLELGAADLAKFQRVELTAVLQCSGNGRGFHEPHVPGVQWGHGAMGQAVWSGVRLADLLAKAGVPEGAAHLRIAGADVPPGPKVPRYIRGFPIERALDPGTLVADRMNGEPLSLAHGAPFRLVVPGWTGNHWVKWLKAIRLQREEPEGFYYQTGYRFPKVPGPPGVPIKPENMGLLTRLPIRSVIAAPVDGARLPAGSLEVVGVAFSGEAKVGRVELALDGQPWVEAQLEGEAGAGRWQVFRRRFEGLSAGEHRLAARASDARGAAQPEQAVWNPSGYLWNAWHRVTFGVVA